jgi:hypothetical protein
MEMLDANDVVLMKRERLENCNKGGQEIWYHVKGVDFTKKV